MRVLKKKTQLRLVLASGVLLVGVVAAIFLRGNDIAWGEQPVDDKKDQNVAVKVEDKEDAPKKPAETVDTPKTEEPKEKPVAKPAEQPTEKAKTETKSEEKATNSSDYSYTAAAGDSYTTLARQAIAKYTEANKLNLSAADALVAEVTLANSAGSPLLEVGQKVELSADDIKKALPSTTIETKSAAAEKTADKSNDKSDDKKSEAKASDNYSYTTPTGGSYTEHARAAVGQYVKDKKLELTPAQALAAESNLTVVAGSPLLDVGQQVTIAKSAVKSAVEAAKNLSVAEQVVWQVYL